MTIQAFLLIVLAALAFYALAQRNHSFIVSAIILVGSLTGMVLVFFPDFSTRVANLVGVGRGADLILYVFVVLTLGAVFNLHLRIRSNHEVITFIVREMSLKHARRPADGDSSPHLGSNDRPES